MSLRSSSKSNETKNQDEETCQGIHEAVSEDSVFFTAEYKDHKKQHKLKRSRSEPVGVPYRHTLELQISLD